MKNNALLLLLALLTGGTTNAQNVLLKPAYLNYQIDSLTKSKILTSLEVLFDQIKNDKIDPALIYRENAALSRSVMTSFAGMEENKQDSITDFYRKQLINIYPVSTNEYWISIAFIGAKNNAPPVLKSIINLVAINQHDTILFSIPVRYLTKTWQTKVAGNVTYFFRDKMSMERAEKFNAKNTMIANKLGVQPEKLNFYLCHNYQEILQLLGYEYDMESNGKTRDGYGVDANTIFSIMHNEDFSHDIFHYYSAKIRGDAPRNRTAEEGIAYSWGNAYYTGANGEMIEQKELVEALKAYLKENPKIDLLELFNKDPKIFKDLPPEVSVKSTIAGVICDEVERKKGMDGIRSLLKCGRGDDNFFRTLNDLMAINRSNFDPEVRKLIEKTK